ncbi:MAG: LTA synthase family protein [Bacteroidales bacterium]|nr:LTA synthase family protein [Bacteroidales bacterium]
MNKFIKVIKYLLSVHLTGLLIFSLIRLVLFLSAHQMLGGESALDTGWTMVSSAFLRGVWFDNVIACYILTLPLLLLSIAVICNLSIRPFMRISSVWFSLLYSLAFLISVVNIPYFKYFFTPINSSIFEWFEYASTTTSMIVGEASYVWYILSWLLIAIVFTMFVFGMQKSCCSSLKRSDNNRSLPEFVIVVALSCVAFYGCYIGMRGRFGYNPIKVSQAYFCRNPFLNQLGLSPVHYLLYSSIDMSRSENNYISLIDSNEAQEFYESYMADKNFIPDSVDSVAPKNVVFIIMESMSAKFMERFGSDKGVTPFLDSIYDESISFPNFYSAGVHTNHGLFSSLYSYPALMRRNLMKGSVIPTYEYGLPQRLLADGYKTAFFMTHESQYDNMNGFFRTNGYEEIYAEENYPASKVVNSFGVADDYLFEYALPVLNGYAESGSPFFATILTISNHPPYILPDWFKAKSSDMEYAIVEYADFCIADFFNKAKKEPWFKNTIFIFMGDHGKVVGNSMSEMPESYNHVPFMVYYHGVEPYENYSFAGQMDVTPTILDILGVESKNSDFGIDLMQVEREKIFYTSDNAIGARDSSHLYIYMPQSEKELYYHITEQGMIPVTQSDSSFTELKKFGLSMIQATEDYMKAKREQVYEQ